MAAINPTVRAVALSNYLAECTAKAWAFDWQHNNCCHFAARCCRRTSRRSAGRHSAAWAPAPSSRMMVGAAVRHERRGRDFKFK